LGWESCPDRNDRIQESQRIITIPSVLVNGKGSVTLLYSFEDLVQLQAARTLGENGISVRRIGKDEGAQ
jgi:hypothetical protein